MKKLDATIERFIRNAEYERTHGSLQGCMDFKQLAEWLKDYKRLLEQEPKTGHWIDCCERDPYYRCSECRERIFGSYRKYCPNCGAKMK